LDEPPTMNQIKSFEQALVPFRRDMVRLMNRPSWRIQSESDYIKAIYNTVSNPNWLPTSYEMEWEPERYLLTHYREEFLAWLKLQQ
jgi:hypothetical protein